jgi:hypothetical protein
MPTPSSNVPFQLKLRLNYEHLRIAPSLSKLRQFWRFDLRLQMRVTANPAWPLFPHTSETAVGFGVDLGPSRLFLIFSPSGWGKSFAYELISCWVRGPASALQREACGGSNLYLFTANFMKHEVPCLLKLRKFVPLL